MSAQKAFITGASSGIGATYADRLAQRGYNLVLVARDEARMQAQAKKLHSENGVAVEVLAADLTVPGHISRVEERLSASDITLFLNNAGMSLHGSLMDNGPDQLTRIIALNCIAPTRLASVAATSFRAKGSGVIINIGSVLSLAPEMMDGVYSATKAFVLNLSQSMAVQLAGTGVHVQVVLPGATRTEIWQRAGNDLSAIPAAMVMDVEALVDAALVGLDKGETVTIPPLHDVSQFEAMTQLRQAMIPHLSTDTPASRYTAD